MQYDEVYIILDEKDNVYGVAPTKTQAKMQTNWFLPKENKYRIVKRVFCYADND